MDPKLHFLASLGTQAQVPRLATANPGIQSTSALVNRCDDDDDDNDDDNDNDNDNDNDYVCVCVVLVIVVFVLVVLVLAVVSAIINNMKRSDAIS